MTDNEIIKALECCVEETSEACFKCALRLTPYLDCKTMVQKQALDLINRQKAEIERLTAQNGVYETCNARKQEAINSLENSLAISKKETKRYVENYKRQKKEMEEYRNIIERATKGIREVKAMLPRELAKERAKAVKEFAERLKSKHRRILDYDEAGFSAPTDVVYVETIDNLVKEFTEEK